MESIWQAHTPSKSLDSTPVQLGNLKSDVLIIGAGLTGLLTSYRLKKLGIKSTVIESADSLGGQSACSCGVISAHKTLIYTHLYRHYGKCISNSYALSNMMAVQEYKEIIGSENIPCDYTPISSCMFTQKKIRVLEREQKYAQKSGIETHLINNCQFPLITSPVLELKNQAQINPLKLMDYLARDTDIIFGTTAERIDNRRVITNRGTINAEKIVIATHIPFINSPGCYFFRLCSETTYSISFKHSNPITKAFVSSDSELCSVRSYGDNIIISGQSHLTGRNSRPNRYEALKSTASSLTQHANPTLKWSSSDYFTGDRLPYIGHLSKRYEHIFVATGYGKSGLTSAMTASRILSEMVLGRKPQCDIFSPSRIGKGLSPKLVLSAITNNAIGLGNSMLQVPQTKPHQIKPNSGDIVENGHRKAAMFLREDGESELLDALCPHMGCQVEWNGSDKSWDCPCHGSRFTRDGRHIAGPAHTDLNREEKLF